MFENNTKVINKMIAKALAWCTIFVITLVVTRYMSIFNFKQSLMLIIEIYGVAVCVTPIILYKIKISDIFLKYYMFINLSMFIGMLGCYSGIGIYITFALVPVKTNQIKREYLSLV